MLTIYFDPLPDITTYELAQIVGRVGAGITSPRYGLICNRSNFDAMPAGVQRHFKLTPPHDMPVEALR